MKSPQAKQALTEYLLRQPEAKRAQMRLVTPTTLGTPLLLHISIDNLLERFQPSVTKRTADGEDRGIPRISTAPSLIACLMGYQSDLSDFHEVPETRSFDGTRKVVFKGGWIIYGFPFDVAIRPSKALVPDADRTDEHWLVTYDRFTTDYRPVRVGKVFYDRVEYQGSSQETPHVEVTMLIEVHPEMTLWLGGRYRLRAGYWRVVIRDMDRLRSAQAVEFVRIQEIDHVEYEYRKGAVANLLSLDSPAPPTQTWTPA
jgi:hypothetical protein